MVGPSTMRGLGGGTGAAPSNVGMIARSIPTRLAEILNAMGVPAEQNNAIGTGGYLSSVNSMDPRVVVGANWTEGAFNQGTVGGRYFQHQVASQEAITFTPLINYNAFDAYFLQTPTGGGSPAEVLVNGVAASTGTFDLNQATQALYKKTFTVTDFASLSTPGKLTIAARKAIAQTNRLCFMGFDCYDTTARKVSVLNLGWGSSSVTDKVATTPTPGWNHINALPVVAPDLTIIMDGTNDWWGGKSLAAFETGYQQLITAAKTTGDVVCCTFHADARTDGTPVTNQEEYNNIIRKLAASNGCVLVELDKRFVSYAASSPLGYYSDFVHLRDVGYLDAAQALASVLVAA
ncbi:SGNH/GDSL hydrolase family protein [Sphingobium sp.]|uniref:SGNH/GDSL hydrolase family protein n=1 Tax=Sphingobium sp. TaxID=1912891 RepID=UPI002CD18D4C|nr:SGNH/GDSL hydrolase family protein [Sphingobium sp.]HUD91227.1 SGNH/GDSL hydrolase family protein [Sphingobium sp.]